MKTGIGRRKQFAAAVFTAACILLTGALYTHAATRQEALLEKAYNASATLPQVSFFLAWLDNDNEPEMIINYDSVAGGEEIFAWDGSQVVSLFYEYYTFNYIPRTGMIRIGGGRMGHYYDDIYRYENGRFNFLWKGEFEAYGTGVEYDESGHFVMNDQFTYTVNGQQVDAQTYLSLQAAYYDKAQEISPYDKQYDLEGLRTQLAFYGSDSTDSTYNIEQRNENYSGQDLYPEGGPYPGTGGGTGNLTFISSDVSEYPTVRLYFDFSDQSGQPITISSLDGTITESIQGGAAIERTVRKVERLAGNQGLSIDIVADKSGSMEYDLPTMQTIMSDFVSSLDYATGDQAEVLSFDSYVMYMCTYTQDVNLLRNGISNMTAYGDTALYDALAAAINNAANQAGARCVIGFTDGEDNASGRSADEVIYMAQRLEVPVYLIGTYGADQYELRRICEMTGGYYWSISDISDIRQILQTIYRSQKDMYCVEYVSDAGADPYCSRSVNCSLSGSGYFGSTNNLVFQAVPALQETQHASRYEIIRSDVSWTQANEICISKGGHLATITSRDEMIELARMCEQAGIKYCWIGGYTSVRNGQAFGHWITGEPFDYTAWYPGEPSRNDSDGTPEFYLMLWKVEDVWSWNDQRDDLLSTGLTYFIGNIGYICEYEN